jgi:hypothetical protein
LFLEATITHTRITDCSVNYIFRDIEAYRILIDLPGVSREADNGTLYRLGYPEALLMLSSDKEFDIPLMKGAQ